MKLFSCGIIFCLVLLTIQGVFAESLISFDLAIKPNPYATDDLISRAGTLNIPAGMGILTTNEIIQPYWAPKGDLIPIRVEYSPVQANGPIPTQKTKMATYNKASMERKTLNMLRVI